MEILREYWYVGLGALVLLYIVASRSSSGGSVTQIRQGTDTVALAQIASAEREADEARKFGVATGLLQYDLSLRGLGLEREQARANVELNRLSISNQVEIARIGAESNNIAAQNAYQLAQLQANSTQYTNQLQYQMAQYNAERAYNAQRRNDWLGAITSGVQTILPMIFGNSTSGGQMSIPRSGGMGGGIYPSGSWTWGF
jgi:hypothetical protein